MSPANQPLFPSERRSSTYSDERAAEEDDALLGNQLKASHTPRNSYGFWREVGLFTWAVLATAAVIVLAVLYQHQAAVRGDSREIEPTGKRNLIFMVSDGMGPASLSLTRSFRQHRDGLPPDDILVLDQHFIGSSRTRSISSLITDSAAGATAFSCGMKSYNGAISMLPVGTPCGTVLEAAKKSGYMTGLVVTTDITDATPACFASHAYIRFQQDLIAQQEIGEHPLGRVVDLMLGGGRCHFLPNTSEGSCRGDDRDIIKMAKEEYGWTYVNNREGFDKLKLGKSVKLPLLGLFAGTDFPFALDRRNMKDTYPSLDEMVQTALKALEDATKGSDKGFFLMIEGSRIDHAGHLNDPAAQVHEVLEYDQAFETVVTFLGREDIEGVAVSTSDHETGGLAVARQLTSAYPEYLWHPEVLANATNSAEHLAQRLNNHISSPNNINLGTNNITEYVSEKLVKIGLGIIDASDAELDLIVSNPLLSANYFADMISRRAQIGWSTHGHSAVDVNIYGSAGSDTLHGNHENTEIGKFLQEYLNVDVDAVTEELVNKSKSFIAAIDGQSGWMEKTQREKDLQLASHEHEVLYGEDFITV